jgi:hypothetical protein
MEQFCLWSFYFMLFYILSNVGFFRIVHVIQAPLFRQFTNSLLVLVSLCTSFMRNISLCIVLSLLSFGSIPVPSVVSVLYVVYYSNIIMSNLYAVQVLKDFLVVKTHV